MFRSAGTGGRKDVELVGKFDLFGKEAMNRFDTMGKDAMNRVEEIMNTTRLNDFLHRKEEEEKKKSVFSGYWRSSELWQL